ncbi:hypothetical protein Hanom_Chr06g00564281 [Helianthus anomalus]
MKTLHEEFVNRKKEERSENDEHVEMNRAEPSYHCECCVDERLWFSGELYRRWYGHRWRWWWWWRSSVCVLRRRGHDELYEELWELYER